MGPSTRPTILLATTCRWVATARLAVALAAAGCEVAAVCPRGHPLTRIRAASRIHPYRPLAPLRSVGAAIDAARPDFVIPCDDLATTHLHRLYDGAGAPRPHDVARRTLLEHSLGDPASFPVSTARAALIAFAHERGIRVPATAPLRTAADLGPWIARHGLPAALKADGTYGGRGVRIVRTEAEALAAFQALSGPPSPVHALTRALVNRDLTYLPPCTLRRRPAVSVQRFVAGRDANSTVVCSQGQVLASITVSVVQAVGEHGPASVVRLLDHAEIAGAIQRLVRELKLSGLFGCDFIVEEGTGAAHLIELNPRATQVSHMDLGRGRDLPGALRAMLCNEPARDASGGPAEGDLIALFPQEWSRDPASPFLTSARHDVPWDEPDLLRACIEEDLRSKVWSRLTSSLRSLTRRERSFAPRRES